MASKKSKKIKRYMKKAFKLGTKPVTPITEVTPVNHALDKYIPPFQENHINPLHDRFEALNELCQDKLDFVYNGTIKPLSTYFNDNTIVTFKCESCGLVFFGKISHIVNKPSHHHICHKDYGGQKVNNRTGSISKRNKDNRIDGDKLITQLDELLDKKTNYRVIRAETGVDTQIIEYYDKTFYRRQG